MVPGPKYGIVIINPVSLLLQLVSRTINVFPFQPHLCLPKGICSPFSAVLYSVNDINGKTGSLCSNSN